MGQSKVNVPIEPLNPPTVGRDGYTGLNPHTETLPEGWKHPEHPDSRPLPCPILIEHDVGIKVRDGTTLYADILRPTSSSAKVPAIICWSPFGKKFNGIASLGLMTPWNLGIPAGTLSGLEKFEAPDPADWIPRGYAIVNVDTRGAFDSEGTMTIMGTQEAEDGYDTIEAVAQMEWCSGKVGLAGNSHLAIAQWFIAALQPPSLAAIAPWEGCGDLYREQFARGGIYAGDLFDKLIVKYMLKGRNGLESFRQMYEEHPLANEWWNDKRPDMKKINVPTYITGTWTNTMHGMGAIRAWMEVDTDSKWLRWHPWQEWYDLWGNEQAKEELPAFFDHFLKGVDNGWEKTPRVRMSLLRFGNKVPQAIENIIEEDFPPSRTEYKKLYLGSEEKLLLNEQEKNTNSVSYLSASGESAAFTYTFPETTHIMGMPKAVLYMSCPDHDDFDVYVMIQKLDKQRNQMKNLNIPWKGLPIKSFDEFTPEQETEVVLYKGPVGILRASHRAIDEGKSMHPHWPYHPHEVEEKIEPGKVVRLDIGIWATGIEFEQVLNGSYTGLYLPEFHQDVFLGMPYARDTGEENRFRVPQTLTESWKGVREARHYGPACPDEDELRDGIYGMSENCLSINVIRPSGINETANLPVMFWIHGGSYQVGTSALPQYNLTYLVRRSVEIGMPVLGVSINYRKGAWGMLYSIEIQGSGNANLSLRDMLKGLEWVRENINSFGGDSERVTIWGESAGSFAVGQLLLSYGGRSHGLFHRSIQQSGSATTAWYNGSDWYQPFYNKIVNDANCSDVPDTLTCLRSIDYSILKPILASSRFDGPGFYPTVDGDVIPEFPSILLDAGRFAHIPHMYGTVSDEGTDNAPDGLINTDEDLRDYLLYDSGFNFPNSTVSHILELYPDDPTQGIPLNTGAERFAEHGWQYKRIAAILGDVFYHAPRRHDTQRYSRRDPTYVYRFNTRPFVNSTNGTYTDYVGELGPAYEGVAHFSDVAFVFANPQYVGPWPEYRALSALMSAQWIHFAYYGDPNGKELPDWPKYSENAGRNLVLQTESQGGPYAEEDTYRAAGCKYLTEWARRRHV